MFVLLGIAIGIIAGIIIKIARESNLQGDVYYYADIPNLVYIAILILFIPALFITLLYFIISVILKLRKREK